MVDSRYLLILKDGVDVANEQNRVVTPGVAQQNTITGFGSAGVKLCRRRSNSLVNKNWNDDKFHGEYVDSFDPSKAAMIVSKSFEQERVHDMNAM